MATLPLGCCASKEAGPGDALAPLGPQASLPEYASLAAAYNERVSGLERLHTRATAAVDGRDAEGRKLREKAEGYLLFWRPDRLALLVGKLGDTHLYLGSNPTRYWWIDRISRESVALTGRHDLVTVGKAARLGLPVHPLDLIELLGVLPLPETGGLVEADFERGLLALRPEGPGGRRVIGLDAGTLRPRHVALLAADGATLVEADLGSYEPVPEAGASLGESGGDENAAAVATRVTIRSAAFDGLVRLTFDEPENKPIRPRVFDLEALLDLYKIDTTIDLDAPPQASAGAAPVASSGR